VLHFCITQALLHVSPLICSALSASNDACCVSSSNTAAAPAAFPVTSKHLRLLHVLHDGAPAAAAAVTSKHLLLHFASICSIVYQNCLAAAAAASAGDTTHTCCCCCCCW
jgi:hypothetical protein